MILSRYVKIGKSLKDHDAFEYLVAKPVDELRIRVKEQEKCSDYKRKKSQFASSTIPLKQEMNEDLAKSEKKGNFITEEAVKSNPKNLRFICFINMTISCIILLPLIFNIKSVFLDKAARFSFTSRSRSTNYVAPYPISFSESTKFIVVKSENKTNFITDEAVKRDEAFINMIIVCILMLPFIFKTISVSSDMAAKFSTNYSSLWPRQMNLKFSTSLVSYPMSIAIFPGNVHQLFINFRGEQLRYNFVSHLSDAFRRHEIKFFIDKNEQRGKDLKHLFVRIQESSIALAIFSTRYSESSWCMDELVKMKKLADQGKLLVIPIFYKVEAEDVRKPTSDSEFGKNFWRLAETSSGDQISEWKEALESISYKMGLSLGEKSSEADFVKEIVKEVQRLM